MACPVDYASYFSVSKCWVVSTDSGHLGLTFLDTKYIVPRFVRME